MQSFGLISLLASNLVYAGSWTGPTAQFRGQDVVRTKGSATFVRKGESDNAELNLTIELRAEMQNGYENEESTGRTIMWLCNEYPNTPGSKDVLDLKRVCRAVRFEMIEKSRVQNSTIRMRSFMTAVGSSEIGLLPEDVLISERPDDYFWRNEDMYTQLSEDRMRMLSVARYPAER